MTIFPEQPRELIVVTEYFHPSTGATAQLITDLVDDLSKAGVSLRVLTSTSGDPCRRYSILRFSRSRAISIGILTKLIAGLRFLIGASTWLLLNARSHQCLFIVSNPPFIGLIGLLLLLVRRVPYIFLFQDVFPRSASLTGVLPAKGPLIWIWHKLIRWVLFYSKCTIVLSGSMATRCKTEFGSDINVVTIPNWSVASPNKTSKSINPLAETMGTTEIFSLQYSGNFGRLHDLLTLLEGARLLTEHQVKFVFVGGGAKTSQILRYKQEFNLANIAIFPYQPRENLALSLSACDVSVVSLIPGAEDTVAPSKVYGILASAKPIILIAGEHSELAHLLKEWQCGIIIGNGDVYGLVSAIIKLKNNPELMLEMGQNASKLYQELFGREKSVSSYLELFQAHQMI